MGLSVKERGAAVATFRHVSVSLMETLAAWVPTTPEMEVKLLFGAHIWDAAQEADALGKRTLELRLPLQHSRAPRPAYLEVLGELTATTDTAERVAVLYDVFLPALDARLRRYLDRTDRLMDAPTVRILERMLDDHARMILESEDLRRERPDVNLADRRRIDALASRERALDEIVTVDADQPMAAPAHAT